MIKYLLFAVLMSGDEFQIGSYPTFEECDRVAIQTLKENTDVFSMRCVLDTQIQ